MIELSFEPSLEEGHLEPTKMVMIGFPKLGKTTAVAGLPNHLIVDLESTGTKFVKSNKKNIKEEANKLKMHPLKYFFELANAIREENAKQQRKVYDFIILDPLTSLEDYATELATVEYKKSVMGSKFTGTNIIKELQQGAGYEWQRDSFKKLMTAYEGLAGKCLILVGHVKIGSLIKKGDNLQTKDLNLTGKLKSYVTSEVDCTGFIYRNKSTNENILSFVSEEQDLITGSRLPHLGGKEFLLSKKLDDGSVETYWEEIFPSIKTV